MRSELQNVLTAVRGMSLEELPDLLGELETIRATALLRMTAAPPFPQQSDELLGVKAAAERLGVSTDYLYRHAGTLPFTRRIGRKLLFSSRGIDAYLAKQRR